MSPAGQKSATPNGPATTLVIMAAGLGSRFGGTKQLVDVGPNGEVFLDFAIRDAVSAGAGKVVIIVRSEIEEEVREHLSTQHDDAVPIVLSCQDAHGPARAKPWGTGHAILSAAHAIDTPFLVVNADDYYGPTSYRVALDALRLADAATGVITAFRLAKTLPVVGQVSRGVCTADDSGRLASVVETHGIGRGADGAIASEDPPGVHGDDTLVSMNMWGFPAMLLGHLEAMFATFLADHGEEEKSEFLLPDVVSNLMNSGELTVVVTETDEQWIGVTNPDDLEPARAALRQR